MTDDARPALPDGSLDALQHGRAASVRRPGLSEEVSRQLFKLVGHPSGELAMMGFRVLMYAGGLVGACVYLAKLKEVRGLTASAHQLEDEIEAGELSGEDTSSSERDPDSHIENGSTPVIHPGRPRSE